ncbi:MAG: hypothetical protein LBC20_12960 [Planctomycetaceae bacterium]|jgi:predicted Rossmann fold nucleotide-binding protein DprA/Smf involved in DNA uptake|nr:hypothetical protein [Planctomycetaceae bacterium]
MNEKQITDLKRAKSLLASYAFLAENLYNNGIEMIPVISSEYSKTLKENLKKSIPIVLYIKGNKKNKNYFALKGTKQTSLFD